MDAAGLLPNERWLAAHLKTSNALGADSNDVIIWQLIRFRLVGLSDATFTSASKSSATQPSTLLDIPRDLAFRGGGDG
jgi:hypothetical protein